MMGYVHQVRSRGGGVVGGTRDCFATSFSSLLFSVVFIQCYYDVTTSPSPSDFNPNPFVMSPNPIYASASGANRDPYPTPLYQVRSMPRYYLAAPTPLQEDEEPDTGMELILKKGDYPEYPRRMDPRVAGDEEQQWIQRMMSHREQQQQASQSPSSSFSFVKRGPIEDFSVTNYKKNVNIPCNSKSPCKKPFDTSFQCKCPNMNQCWAPSAQHDATCKFASPPFGVMFYQP